MKEAGIERDKQIGILKGAKITHPEWHGVYPNEMSQIKNWSTSWNDAKELWDELPFDKRYYENQNEDYSITYAVKVLGEFFYGKDFPDAVSQAWIKWKETQ